MPALPADFTRRARLGDQPCVVLVQLGNFVLLHDCCLVGQAQFGLQLLDLRLVPARFLFALLATGGPVVFERLVCVLQLLLERLAEAFVFGKPHGLVVHLLRESLDVDGALLCHQMGVGVRILFARERGGRVGQLRLQCGELTSELGNLGLGLLALGGRGGGQLVDARLGFLVQTGREPRDEILDGVG